MKSLLTQRSESLRKAEEERTRQAYLQQPDSESEADDWSSADEWKPRNSSNRSQ